MSHRANLPADLPLVLGRAIPTIEFLMQAPVADWPAPARAEARALVSTHVGLAALRAKRHKRAWVVHWVVYRLERATKETQP